jgi:hypothetical protein
VTLPLPLLQSPRFDFFQQPDPQQNVVTMVVLIALIVLGVIGAIVSNRRGGSPGGQRFSKMAFRRQAKALGLDPYHIRELISLAKRLRLRTPMRMLTDPAYMNYVMRRAVRAIDATALPEVDRETEKALIFQAKQLLTMSASGRQAISSSRRIRPGTEVRITDNGNDWHETVMTSSAKDTFAVKVPYDRRGNDILWDKGTKLAVQLFAGNDGTVYTFPTRVMGLTRSRGASNIVLAHSDHVRQTQKRKHPRREFDRPAFYWPVNVVTVGSGRKAKKQAVVNNARRGYGRMEDVSAGGCAIRSSAPLKAGTLLKVEFETDDKEVLTAFGKVRGTEKTPSRYGLMHIMFTKMSRKNLNQINAYVYGITDDGIIA